MLLRLVAPLALALVPAAGAAAAPWDGPPFSASPRALVEAAEALSAARGPGVDVLLEEGTWRFDKRGAATFSHRIVFRPLMPESARRWARVERSWAPWHQARPEIRARVVSPSGEASDLDPRTLGEQVVGDRDGEVWSERRVLSGPLPGVVVGAIVEEVATVRETAPLFDGGVVHRFWMAQANPIRLSRLRIEAPESLPLRWVAHGIDARSAESASAGVRTIVFERRDVLPARPVDPGSPRDLQPAPVVLFGWGRSWADVAERYAALWSRPLADADVRDAARAVLGGKLAKDEAVRRVVAWVRQNVRATAVELGERPVAPASPAETLRKRQGDSKDLSLLVVAMLREAGVEARIALIRTAWQDLARELPALNQLDRAIVRVDGKEPIWIDPADRLFAPGKLPLADQGRPALLIPGGDLVRTPEPGPEENEGHTVREIHVAELGPGRVVETRTLTGALAAAERGFRQIAPVGHQDALDERYAREVLHGETFLGAEVVGEADLAAPLRIRVETDRSAVVETGDETAEVPVSPDAVFEALPRFVTGRGEGGEGEGREPPQRSNDLVVALPYRSEIVYRVLPPDGLRARPLPADRSERFGPATYTQRFALEKDGSVTATFRFDTGGRLVRAADADALGRRVREILRGRSPRVTLERFSSSLLAAGRVREAVAEIRRLAQAHPREALHHLHLALALLQIGVQEESAAEARRAIALEPERSWAHRVLGYVLEHDAVGRFHGPGFDRAGALAAYEAAKAKDPRHAGGRAALAELLAHDASGLRHGAGADLARAIDEYLGIRTELGDRTSDPGLLAALFAAGRHAQAVALAREIGPSEERNAVLVAAVAALSGAAKAEDEAQALGDDRREALRGAAGLLVRQRRYAPAAALAAAAARGAPNAAELFAQSETFAALRPWEKSKDDGDEAARLVKKLFVAAIAARDRPKELGALLSTRIADDARAALEASVPFPPAATRHTLRESGLPSDVLLDLVLSKLEMARDGDAATGLRVRLRFPFAQGERGEAVYLAREGGALRVVASDAAWPLIGAEAERRAAAGDLAAAARWLRWAREAVPGADADPSTPAGILAATWSVGGDLGAARRAGAALAAFAGAGEKTLTVLATARRSAREPAERRALAFAVAAALRQRGDAEGVLALADEILAEDPSSRAAFGAKAWALRRLGRRAAVWPAAEAILARLPDDADVLGATGSTLLLMGDVEGAARAWKRLIDSGKAPAIVYNNAAWLDLSREPPGKDALAWARRAVDESRGRDYASLNTLAAAFAEQGKPAEAREIFLRSIDGGRELSGPDWFVFGRIAEAWELPAPARAAYARVQHDTGDDADDPTSAYRLARRRLERLGGAAESAPAAHKER